MPRRRHLTVQEAARAIGMLEARSSQRQVGAQLGVSHSVIGRLLERYEQTNTVKQRPKSGRQKSTTARQIDKFHCLPREIECHQQLH